VASSAGNALGASGEAAVAAHYAARGFDLLARNWRCSDGEIDLIVRRGGLCVFCEVKTRSSQAFGAPVEAVTFAKQRRLRRLAGRWLSENAGARSGAPVGGYDVRFDVASVLRGVIEVIEGAF
jgi:putative endonuclease